MAAQRESWLGTRPSNPAHSRPPPRGNQRLDELTLLADDRVPVTDTAPTGDPLPSTIYPAAGHRDGVEVRDRLGKSSRRYVPSGAR